MSNEEIISNLVEFRDYLQQMSRFIAGNIPPTHNSCMTTLKLSEAELWLTAVTKDRKAHGEIHNTK